jgi:YD repeat-containing protein
VPNRIQGSQYTWNYDPAGNLQQVGGMTRSFTYDAENRQVTANVNGTTAAYGYDGNGLRVTKTSGRVYNGLRLRCLGESGGGIFGRSQRTDDTVRNRDLLLCARSSRLDEADYGRDGIGKRATVRLSAVTSGR